MQNLRFFVEALPDAMSAILPDDGTALAFCILLDRVPDIAQSGAGSDQFDTRDHGPVRYVADALALDGRLADQEHFAGVAVPAILDDGDINIDDVTVFQPFITGNAMANYVVDRSADRLGKTPVIERCRNGFLRLRDVLVTDLIQFTGGDAGLDVGTNHVQHFGSQLSCKPHFFHFISGFKNYSHIPAGRRDIS